MKSRFSRIILSILILSLALSACAPPSLAQSEPKESLAEVENLNVLQEIEEPTDPDDRDAQPYPEDGFVYMPPEYIPPSPEIIAKTQEQVKSFNCANVTDVSQIECEALVALYESTNGAGWDHNRDWLESTTVRDWYGVTIDSGVTSLDLHWNNLTGSIPSTLSNLSNLESLSLYLNQLTGSIPANLGSLSNLQWLDLSDNLLTGSIPLSFVNLTNIIVFYFSETNLCEPTTPEFSAWKNTVYSWSGTGIICER
ncbi:MAG: hypothetical protein KBA03_00520 [Anaerolineaceae bacterium]|nr:hypothetical protein [Anaerolineaceae bacterium]